MDAVINWGIQIVAAHPRVAQWLILILAVDQILKMAKNALKLNIPDNVFDWVGDAINKILSKNQTPKI